jgi:uncharacterized protein (DUF983 family)
MRKLIVAVGAVLVSEISYAGSVWVPVSLSVPTMSEFALAALAVAVGIAASRYAKKK